MIFWENSISYFYYKFFIGNNKVWFYPEKILEEEKRNKNDNKAYYKQNKIIFKNKKNHQR